MILVIITITKIPIQGFGSPVIVALVGTKKSILVNYYFSVYQPKLSAVY